jgi:RNA polymerase sigma-70 factor (family 1)
LKESESNIKSTLKSLKNGDKRAFNRIYNYYYSKLYYFIFSITKSKYNSEEILQAVFIKIWTNRKNIDLSKSFDSFIFTITRNLTLNHLRTISNRESLRQELWRNMKQTSLKTDNDILSSEYKDILDDILQGIPTQKRSVYVLSKEQGKSNQEIADLLGISKKTVKNHLWKTLQIIKEQLQPYILSISIFYLISRFIL